MGIDWGVGRYEATGELLSPVSELVVELAEPLTGRTVLDVGCGTGNAALAAAARGAVVTGVDPANRLLEVARSRAAERGLEIEFVTGDAAAVPVKDQSADLVISIFAVIFAPDPAAAVAELARVVAPDGRIVISDWLPGGALTAINGTAAKFMNEILGGGAAQQRAGGGAPASLAWHNAEALRAAFAPYGFVVEVEERSMVFEEASAEEYLAQSEQHPMAVTADRALAQRPDAEELRAELKSRLFAAAQSVNENPDAFRVTVGYTVATICRS